MKYPGLTHNVNPKTRWELIDHDYIDKLSEEEKQWLSNFNEEYLSGNFNHKGKKFHKTKKSKRECYTRNNARNRDTFTIGRVANWVKEITEYGIKDKLEEKQAKTNFNHEDIVIDLVDLKRANDEKS